VSSSDFAFDISLTRQQAPKYLWKRWRLKVSSASLATYGSRGGGPRYTIAEGRSRYTVDALDIWAQQVLAKAEEAKPIRKKKKPTPPKKPRKRKRKPSVTASAPVATAETSS
jgi:hypothetical protein